ncbi:MAG: CDP-alcohol phosphatidyltransferase family protein [Pseudomonadales bacterium]
MWLTWANAVTAVRALLALPCAWAAVSQRWDLAAVLLTMAVLSDLLDGPLARRLGQTSALGGLLDHATDAAFVTILLAALASAGYVPWLLPALVAVAFLQYATDSQALRGRSLRASWLGRVNGIAYFALAAVPVYRGALGAGWPPDALIIAGGWLLVLTTATSMLDRLRLWRTAE